MPPSLLFGLTSAFLTGPTLPKGKMAPPADAPDPRFDWHLPLQENNGPHLTGAMPEYMSS